MDAKTKRKHLNDYSHAHRDIELTQLAIDLMERVGNSDTIVKALFHRHHWRGMEWDEWQKAGGQGTPDWICDKCGERRFWCDT